MFEKRETQDRKNLCDVVVLLQPPLDGVECNASGFDVGKFVDSRGNARERL